MAIFSIYKVVSALPDPLQPDTLYLVRTGNGFDLYCSDATGSIAHPINTPISIIGVAEPLIVVSQDRTGLPFSISRFNGFNLPINKPTAILLFRLTTNQKVRISDFEVAFGANATIRAEIMQLATVNNLPSSTTINGVEYWLPNNDNVDFTGSPLTSTLGTQNTRQATYAMPTNLYLETNVFYALVTTSNVNNLALQACLVNLHGERSPTL